jgi:glycosyltransferase involved in cell wall biosynthesis
MHKLSVAIITFNEEANIARCLKSVASIANEIVVVDSFSTDATQSICQQFATTFISQKFLGYTTQKNIALQHCTNNFVLCLDADECLTPAFIKDIATLKQNGFAHDVYYVSRCTNFCGKWIKHGMWYPEKIIRLIDKTKASWGGINIHEKIEFEANAKVGFLKNDILHYSFNSIDQLATKSNVYTTLQANEMNKIGKKASVFNLIFNPMLSFINGYFLKLGFLDGLYGLIIAKSIAYFTFLKYAKLRHLNKTQLL